MPIGLPPEDICKLHQVPFMLGHPCYYKATSYYIRASISTSGCSLLQTCMAPLQGCRCLSLLNIGASLFHRCWPHFHALCLPTHNKPPAPPADHFHLHKYTLFGDPDIPLPLEEGSAGIICCCSLTHQLLMWVFIVCNIA